MKNFAFYVLVLILPFGFWILTFNVAHAGFVVNRPLYIGLASGLVGYWGFDGQDMAGVTAYDRSGQNNTGLLTNGPTRAIGKIGQGLGMDGVNDAVDITDANILDITGDLTISAWVKFNTLPGSGAASAPMIVTKGRTTANTVYRLWVPTTNVFRLSIVFGGVTKSASTAGSVSTGAWYHIVAERSDAQAIFYINGALDSTDNTAFTAGASSDTNALDLFLGNSIDNSTGKLDGIIDDVRIYNRALSSDEIKRLYKIGATTKIRSRQIGSPAVTVDAVTTKTDTTSTTFAHKVSGSNRLLIVGASVKNTNLTRVTYADVDLTFLGRAEGSNAFSEIWALVNPALGTNNVVTTQNGNADVSIAAISFTGVDQRNPYGKLASASGSSVTPSVTVTSADGELVVDNLAMDASTASVGAGQTQQWNINSGVERGAGSTEPGAQTVTMSWSSDNRPWGITGISIKPVRTSFINSSQNQKLTNGLVGHWSFDGPDMANVTAFDRSGQNNNGTLTNGPARAIGRIGQALSFDGVDDYVTAARVLPATVPWSISAWINPFRAGNSDEGNGIFYQGTLLGDIGTALLVLNSPSISNGLDFINEGNVQLKTGSNTITLNTWQHVAATRDAGGTGTIYVNGVAVTSGNSGISTPTNNNVALGTWYNAGPTRFFQGRIDDVRVYNRVLSSDEIKRLYNMGR